jgi:excinuclease ABC subunit A
VRVHNLRSIDVEIPRNRLTVITGVSGSGKSSLAFDTLYAEGRRRYVECLSTYMQQFLERMARPELDGASGLPPAVAIERGVPAAQARSTVGTTTEISDYLRLLFARVGRTRCVRCDRPVVEESPGHVAALLARRGGRATIGFVADEPSNGNKGWLRLREELERDGFARVVLDGRIERLENADYRGGPIEVVVDRLSLEPRRRARLAEAVETAYRFGHERAIVRAEDGTLWRFSRRLHCPHCDLEFRRPEPRLFSPNSPLGACTECQGFGRSVGPDFARIIPDDRLTLADGPVDPWNKPSYRGAYRELKQAGKQIGLRWDVPYRDLPPEHRELVEKGGHGFYGIRGFFDWLEGRTYKVHVRVFLARYRAYRPCRACDGTKLRPEALAVRVGETDVAAIARRPVEQILAWVRGLGLEHKEREIARPILVELERRLGFLVDVGLGYLSLERPSRTLSGGEAQRIQLARSLGSSLVDTLYVLDEPSVGLHPLDVDRLIGVLLRLRDMGNTVVVVEHDPRVMRRADWLIDLGPGAGEHGGEVVHQGDLRGLRDCAASATRRHLERVDRPRAPRTRDPRGIREWIELEGASIHNLSGLDVRFPLGALTVVTGVSGSGKSSLVHDTLYGALAQALGQSRVETGPYRALRGHESLSAVDLVDQSPIGRSPRSNPVTYVKAFDGIRKRLAATRQARARGFSPGFFSFNVPGGRCEKCEGAGSILVEMHFLPDVLVPCDACGATRYGAQALQIEDRGYNVARILGMTVDRALEFYRDAPDVARRLHVLQEVGLGYLRLGQPAPTLSGGEAQRLKLAAHLGTRGRDRRLFLLDEPTTGLHMQDVEVLLELIDRLIERGHSVLVVEHHLELIRRADWILDLGPGPGADGGRLVATGPPATIAASDGPTGRYLSDSLGRAASTSF